jgi:hypothetical protein
LQRYALQQALNKVVEEFELVKTTKRAMEQNWQSALKAMDKRE